MVHLCTSQGTIQRAEFSVPPSHAGPLKGHPLAHGGLCHDSQPCRSFSLHIQNCSSSHTCSTREIWLQQRSCAAAACHMELAFCWRGRGARGPSLFLGHSETNRNAAAPQKCLLIQHSNNATGETFFCGFITQAAVNFKSLQGQSKEVGDMKSWFGGNQEHQGAVLLC